MGRATGAAAKVYIKAEDTYGTAATGNYTAVPFMGNSLGSGQELLDEPILGEGREPQASILGAINVAGDVNVPVDVRNFGFWLQGLCGAPTTTGTSPYVHTFNSGADDADLPSFTIETAHTDVDQYRLLTGCKVNSIAINVSRTGVLKATVNVIGKNEAMSGSSGAGTPTTKTLEVFGQFQGALLVDGGAVADVTGVDFTLSNNLEVVESLTTDGTIGGADATGNTVTGSMKIRFQDDTYFDKATSATAVAIKLTWTISASKLLEITLHACQLDRPKVEISGPGGIESNFNFKGKKGASYSFTAVLKNDQAGTVYGGA